MLSQRSELHERHQGHDVQTGLFVTCHHHVGVYHLSGLSTGVHHDRTGLRSAGHRGPRHPFSQKGSRMEMVSYLFIVIVQ